MIFLCITFLCALPIYAEDNSSQALKPEELENILKNVKVTRRVVDLNKKTDVTTTLETQSSSKNFAKNVSHSGISLKSSGSTMSKASTLKPTGRWIKGKVSKAAPSSPDIANSQSEELQKLEKQRKDRKASFKKSLKTRSERKSMLLENNA